MMETTLQSLFSIPPRNFGSKSSSSFRLRRKQAASAKKSGVCQILAPLPVAGKVGGSIFSYRHDWGALSGSWSLFLDWDAINARSGVFVSLAAGWAGGPDVGRLIGEAQASLFDVTPTDGGIDVRVNIDGSVPIQLYADYLVVNA
jgi:hypothetical protein